MGEALIARRGGGGVKAYEQTLNLTNSELTTLTISCGFKPRVIIIERDPSSGQNSTGYQYMCLDYGAELVFMTGWNAGGNIQVVSGTINDSSQSPTQVALRTVTRNSSGITIQGGTTVLNRFGYGIYYVKCFE